MTLFTEVVGFFIIIMVILKACFHSIVDWEIMVSFYPKNIGKTCVMLNPFSRRADEVNRVTDREVQQYVFIHSSLYPNSWLTLSIKFLTIAFFCSETLSVWLLKIDNIGALLHITGKKSHWWGACLNFYCWLVMLRWGTDSSQDKISSRHRRE